MTTITFILAITASIISVFTLLMTISQYRSFEIYMYDLEQGLRECASRTSENKLNISTIDNRTKAKPKAKRGRPRKNAPKSHKIIHQLNGE
jgi:hypothetical protein